jgi:hypothetical protein
MFAQSDRGTITGKVTDPGGAVIPGVQVTATHLGTNIQYKATTTESGEFVMPSLPVGDYKVVIESQGFKSAIHAKAGLAGGSTARLDTRLEMGTVQQSIEVSAQSEMLDSADAKLHNDVNTRLIQGLPTVVDGSMRSPFDLAVLTAAASGSGVVSRSAEASQVRGASFSTAFRPTPTTQATPLGQRSTLRPLTPSTSFR